MTGMGDAFGAQLRAAKAEGELAAVRDALREFAEENGLNPEMEPRDLLAKAAGAFRSCAAVSDMRYDEIRRLKEEMEAMRPRLMPEGCKWPRYESGKPVRFGDAGLDVYGKRRMVKGVKLTQGGFAFISDDKGRTWWANDRGPLEDPEIDPDKSIKRPAPKVLDADGVEIRVGDTVYQMGCKYRVSHLHGANGRVRIVYENSGRWVDPKTLTHRAPVLAADGKPLREGETVWDTNGDELVIGALENGGHTLTCRYVDVGDAIPVHGMWSPSDLTHERPDSWERIEEDAGKNPFDYCKDVGHRLDTCENSEAYKARDIVRRAKALAERGE